MTRWRAFGFPVLRRVPPLLVPLIPFQVIRFHGRSAVHGRIAARAAVTCRQRNSSIRRRGPPVEWRSLRCVGRVRVVSANTTHTRE